MTIFVIVLSPKITPPFTSSSNQVADIFTKPLGGKWFSKHCEKLYMIDNDIYALAWGGVLEIKI